MLACVRFVKVTYTCKEACRALVYPDNSHMVALRVASVARQKVRPVVKLRERRLPLIKPNATTTTNSIGGHSTAQLPRTSFYISTKPNHNRYLYRRLVRTLPACDAR